MSSYTPVLKPRSSRESGHFVWLDKRGQVVLSDWSGPHPDGTDDGPLIVIPDRPIELDVYGRADHNCILMGSVDVLVPRADREGRVWTGVQAIRAIVAHTGQRVRLRDHDKALVRDLVALLAPNLLEAFEHQP